MSANKIKLNFYASLLCALLLLTSLNSIAQTIGVTFGGANEDQGIEVKRTTDGNLLIIGFSSSFSENSDVYLVKTDSNGKLLWEKNIGGIKGDYGWDMEETDNGQNYLIVGFSDSYGVGDSDIILTKVTKDGKLLWIKNLPTTGQEDRAVSMEKTKDGNYILIGQSRDDKTKNYDGLVVKVSPDGREIWRRFYGGSAYDRLFYAKETRLGDFILVGISRKDSLAENAGWILLIDQNGNQKESKIINTIKNTTPHGIVKAKKDEFIVVGYAQTDTAKNQRSIYLASFDGKAKLNWEKTTNEVNANSHGLSGVVNGSNGILVAGYSRPLQSGKWKGVVYNFNSKADLQWRKEFDLSEADMPYTVSSIGKNRFAFTGQTNSFGKGKTDVWLVIFDANGNVLN